MGTNLIGLGEGAGVYEHGGFVNTTLSYDRRMSLKDEKQTTLDLGVQTGFQMGLLLQEHGEGVIRPGYGGSVGARATFLRHFSETYSLGGQLVVGARFWEQIQERGRLSELREWKAASDIQFLLAAGITYPDLFQVTLNAGLEVINESPGVICGITVNLLIPDRSRKQTSE